MPRHSPSAGGSFLPTSTSLLQRRLETRLRDGRYYRKTSGTYCLHRGHERMSENLVLTRLDVERSCWLASSSARASRSRPRCERDVCGSSGPVPGTRITEWENLDQVIVRRCRMAGPLTSRSNRSKWPASRRSLIARSMTAYLVLRRNVSRVYHTGCVDCGCCRPPFRKLRKQA